MTREKFKMSFAGELDKYNWLIFGCFAAVVACASRKT